ncbi:MAG: hypothetical protein MZV70_54125 [Desulfobacterales bacterium]|nr:hypothetical protein [Desulfobacterales bacterium]
MVARSNSRGHAQASPLRRRWPCWSTCAPTARTRRRPGPLARRRRSPAACLPGRPAVLPCAAGVAPVFAPARRLHLGAPRRPAGWWNARPRAGAPGEGPVRHGAAGRPRRDACWSALWPGTWWPAPVSARRVGAASPGRCRPPTSGSTTSLVTLWPVGLQPAPTALIDFDPLDRRPSSSARPSVVAITAGSSHAAALALALSSGWPTSSCSSRPRPHRAPHVRLRPLRQPAGAGAPPPSAAVCCGSAPRPLPPDSGPRPPPPRAPRWPGPRGPAPGRLATLFEHMLPLLGEHPFRASIFASLGSAIWRRATPRRWPPAAGGAAPARRRRHQRQPRRRSAGRSGAGGDPAPRGDGPARPHQAGPPLPETAAALVDAGAAGGRAPEGPDRHALLPGRRPAPARS